MPAFHEILFPLSIAFGSSGGPERRTDIVLLASGHEERNTRWADSRRRYNAGTGVHSLADLHTLIGFFEERRGRLHGFRWRDRSDWKSCPPNENPDAADQPIGIGDGETSVFQLLKTYGAGLAPYQGETSKPVSGTVRVAVDGEEQMPGEAFVADHATGLVTFQAGHTPTEDAIVTAGFLFDVPVRFDTDWLDINLASFEAGDAPNVPVVEIK